MLNSSAAGIALTILSHAGPKFYTTGYFPEYTEILKVEGKINVCKNMITFLLSNIDDCNKANMESAIVMPRLMPTILVHLGPIIGEMALVSARQLVLAVFFALSAPAVFATGSFDFNSPRESLNKSVGYFILHKQTPFRAIVMTVTLYPLPSSAITKCLLDLVQPGTSTISD